MFELENEIAGWKQAVDSNGVVSWEEISELESHLRESVALLSEKGLAEQEAFVVATIRLGHPAALQEEYAKNDLTARWKQPMFWMLSGYLGYLVISGMVSALGAMTNSVMALGGFAESATAIAMISLMSIAWSSVIFIVFRGRQQFGKKNGVLPRKWKVAIGSSLIIVPVISVAGQIVQARFGHAVFSGAASNYLFVGLAALHFSVVILSFVALCKLSDRPQWRFE